MAIPAVDVISTAFEHAKQQLFRPFRLGQWTRLAVVGLLAGETVGGCNLNFSSRSPFTPRSGGSQAFVQAALARGPLVVAAIGILILLGLALIVALVYVSSMMRFVLFDSVVTRECHIRRFWRQRTQAGLLYFVWQLVLGVVTIAGFAILVGVAAGVAFGLGWVRNPRDHVLPLILCGLVFLAAVALWFFVTIVVHVLTKDFVVPQMALDHVNPIEGWRRLFAMMDLERARYAGYIGWKILLRIAVTILTAIAGFIAILGILLPIGIPALIVFLAARAAGITWNIVTLTIAFTAGLGTLAIIIYAVLLISAPAVVFFPAYSIHFFAPRYQPLNELLRRGSPPPG
jgi:hypothetical protein